jgi:hypothetical protein
VIHSERAEHLVARQLVEGLPPATAAILESSVYPTLL